METIAKEKGNKQITNPWQWQNQLGFVQAVQVTGHQQVLYCAGQAAMDADGRPQSEGDMRAQMEECLNNLEIVLTQAGYTFSDIVRLNYYTTDVDQFFANYDVLLTRLAGTQFSSTLVGVTRLAFPQLMIELEATAVK